ncbi:hypothetical protein GDO86_010495 [Hymenochirus boettgeri]|uniref:Protein FAM228B n=1 Tax=Hymenochirus boettgeri TaxID=247094 RepID=A0A8T2JKP6_9PIPI|nr:hypothetical protein GDO86_010495 [Hymenochirus boettgeri]KAG8445730.1 hypothetical protein GDO86_010495 [Hymenochirus boettgeri]KAG8445731.1 hypothetical protein GDO86_010495 [Hymenochirus boettgeri]
MSAECRSLIKDGRTPVQTPRIPCDLIPSTLHQHEKSSNLVAANRKQSGLPARNVSTPSNRKARDWLAQKPNVKLLIDEESQEIRRATLYMLDSENHFNQTLAEYLKKTENSELRRKEIQHKRWAERVSGPLQRTIQSHIDVQSTKDIERRRRLVLAQYLKYCNKKGSAFLRDYDSAEYNPFFHQISNQYLQVFTPPFLDPLLQQSQKRVEEKRLTLHCETGRLYSAKEIHDLQKLPQVPLSRQSMDGIKWVKTPFGYIDSDIRQKSRQKVRGTFNQETHNFDS